jgi:hypothetical protein
MKNPPNPYEGTKPAEPFAPNKNARAWLLLSIIVAAAFCGPRSWPILGLIIAGVFFGPRALWLALSIVVIGATGYVFMIGL